MLTINIDSSNGIALYEQIYEYIKTEIMNGSLQTDEKLPSTRNLSTHLQVSRNTIDMAYTQLLSEGYIESIPKRGYFVNDISVLKNLTNHLPKETSTRKAKKDHNTSLTYDFSPLSIDLATFPYHTWQKLTKNVLSDNHDLFTRGENQGDATFRHAILNYLHQSRGVNCSSEQIIVGAGVDYLLQLLNQIIEKNSVIAMEDPAYQRAYQIFRGFDKEVLFIPLDHLGMDVELLSKSHANIAYVTPSHQYPTGIVMPIKRRLELLKWANERSDRFIIEDDHDSEFRYKGKPIPSLQGIDSNEKTIYIGTFSRAIAPAIRIGYMVLPKVLLARYQQNFSYYASTVSRIDQAIMTDFIEKGFFERHLNRMRKIYRNKHDFMLNTLKQFGSNIKILSAYAGLYIVVEFQGDYSEGKIIDLARKYSINLYGLSSHYHCLPANYKPIFLLGFGNLSEDLIQEGLTKLNHCLYQ
ncbi:predicted transcriptional regulator of pyridoxine metabolism [Lachnospiraceae bacterium KM106-2]|nr:predicted transcriptional regulator of pyridoxine metabolism [Lachnospiraceae bacterium KM106-2]